jgi:glycine betaine monooxygenase B
MTILAEAALGPAHHAPAHHAPAHHAPAGRDEFDEDLLCVEVEQVTHDVASFVLRLAGGDRLSFRPGQYLTLTVPVGSEWLSRCYTISSSPLWPDSVTITVKRVPGGPVSNWLHDTLRPGGTVRASGPLGEFSTDHYPAKKYLFLSAGSGVTPLMSMTRTLHGCGATADVAFLHSARTPDDIIFRTELERLDATYPSLRVTVICEEDAGRPWGGPLGRLTHETLLGAVPDIRDREIFTCGPPGYRQAVRVLLARAGVDPARCHEESYDLGEDAPVVPSASGAGSGCSHLVELARTGRVLECPAGMTVLDAALLAGIQLPSSCAEGVCGTCKSQLVSGSVDMRHGGGIRPREVAQGKILLCCSSPCEDLVIDA